MRRVVPLILAACGVVALFLVYGDKTWAHVGGPGDGHLGKWLFPCNSASGCSRWADPLATIFTQTGDTEAPAIPVSAHHDHPDHFSHYNSWNYCGGTGYFFDHNWPRKPGYNRAAPACTTGQRDHIRFFDGWYDSAHGDYSPAAVHHDYNGQNCTHIGGAFDALRYQLRDNYQANGNHNQIRGVWWDNQESIRDCDGNQRGGNGYIDFIDNNPRQRHPSDW